MLTPLGHLALLIHERLREDLGLVLAEVLLDTLPAVRNNLSEN